MAVLDPDRRRLRHRLQRLPVVPGGERPFARVAGAIGAGDDRALPRPPPCGPSLPRKAAEEAPGAGQLMAEKAAGPDRSDRRAAVPPPVEPGAAPILPQRLVEPVMGAERPPRRRWQGVGGQQPPAGPPLQFGRAVAPRRRRAGCRDRRPRRLNQPVAIGMPADKPEAGEHPVQHVVLFRILHRQQRRPRDPQPPRQQKMRDEIARERPLMQGKPAGPEPLGQIVHHLPVVERDLQLERIAQQHDTADLPAGEQRLHRAADVMPRNDPGARQIGEVARLGAARGTQLAAGLPEDPRRTMFGPDGPGSSVPRSWGCAAGNRPGRRDRAAAMRQGPRPAVQPSRMNSIRSMSISASPLTA